MSGRFPAPLFDKFTDDVDDAQLLEEFIEALDGLSEHIIEFAKTWPTEDIMWRGTRVTKEQRQAVTAAMGRFAQAIIKLERQE